MIQYRAMEYYNWNLLEEEPLNPLLGRKTIHGQNVTVARIRLRKGAVVPMHRHPNEQISMLESGALRFTISGEERVLRAGDAMGIPQIRVVAANPVFAPRREQIYGERVFERFHHVRRIGRDDECIARAQHPLLAGKRETQRTTL